MKKRYTVHNVCRGKNFNDGRKGKRKQKSNAVRESIQWVSECEREGERKRERSGVLKRSGSETYLYINPEEVMY